MHRNERKKLLNQKKKKSLGSNLDFILNFLSKKKNWHFAVKATSVPLSLKYFILASPGTRITKHYLSTQTSISRWGRHYSAFWILNILKRTSNILESKRSTSSLPTSNLRATDSTCLSFSDRLLLTSYEMPMVGQMPSNNLTDLRPHKGWKLNSVLSRDSIQLDDRSVLLRTTISRKFFRKKNLLRKSLISKLISKPKPYTKRTRLRTLIKKLYHNNEQYLVHRLNTGPNATRKKRKILLRRVETPSYLIKSKTNYPLLFTNNTAHNRLQQTRLDKLIISYLRHRNARRNSIKRKRFLKAFKNTALRDCTNKEKRKNVTKEAISRLKSRTKSILVYATTLRGRKKKFRKKALPWQTDTISTINTPLKTDLYMGYAHRYAHTQKLTAKRHQRVQRRRAYLRRTLYRKHKRRKVRSNKMPRKKRYILNQRFNLVSAKSIQGYCFDKRALESFLGKSTFVKTFTKTKRHYISDSLNTTRALKPLTLLLQRRSAITNLGVDVTNAEALPKLSASIIRLRTRTNLPFILRNIGMFLHSFLLLNQKNPYTYKYKFKKRMYSFVFPNEIRNAIMLRKKRITLYKLVFKTKHLSKNRRFFSFTSFNKSILSNYRATLRNEVDIHAGRGNLFNSRDTHPLQRSCLLAYENTVNNQDELIYQRSFNLRGNDITSKRTEVRIPRIRFKPGYQRMWRRARGALRESMGLRFIYQQQLTKYLTRFYRSTHSYAFSRSEMTMQRVLMYSRLLPDVPTIQLFIKNHLIYLNGRAVNDTSVILVPNDLIQITVSLWYYVMNRWITNWTVKRHQKFRKLVYRKGLANRHKVMKRRKQKSYYTPHWIHLARYDISDVKPFLEVDYLTLSAFVLYEPYTTYYYGPDDASDFKGNIFRMYNWKYIT